MHRIFQIKKVTKIPQFPNHVSPLNEDIPANRYPLKWAVCYVFYCSCVRTGFFVLGQRCTNSTLFFRRVVGRRRSSVEGPVFCIAPSGDDNVRQNYVYMCMRGKQQLICVGFSLFFRKTNCFKSNRPDTHEKDN